MSCNECADLQGDLGELGQMYETLKVEQLETHNRWLTASAENTVLREQLHAEKMRNATVESVMLFLLVVVGLYAVFK